VKMENLKKGKKRKTKEKRKRKNKQKVERREEVSLIAKGKKVEVTRLLKIVQLPNMKRVVRKKKKLVLAVAVEVRKKNHRIKVQREKVLIRKKVLGRKKKVTRNLRKQLPLRRKRKRVVVAKLVEKKEEVLPLSKVLIFFF